MNLALISRIKGELKKVLMYYEQCLPVFEKYNNITMFAITLNNTGSVYREMGDLDQALVYLERGLGVAKKTRNNWLISLNLGSIIETLVPKGEIEQAQRYLEQLEEINEKEDNKMIKLWYLFCKALVLKTSSRIHNRAKAQELLRQIVQGEIISYEITIFALLNLCDLLLDELRTTNNIEILDEIQPLITQLLEIAEGLNSFWILGETYLLQAKLALIKLDLTEARRLLTQGQQIAEKYGLKSLAMKISNEHDELLKQLSIWEYFKQTKSSLEERLKLSRLSEQMEIMAKKRVIEPLDIIEEIPVVILIMSEGGIPIFSQIFAEEWSFQDHLFGGFLNAVNSFSNEMFSKGLDRAIFGEFTLLMKAANPFLVCYLFKGQSYIAQQRIKYFVDNIQTNNNIWQGLNKFFQTNREIQLKDIPSLKPVISEIFIDKNIPLWGLEPYLK
jgi:tetratricopeptide (TPR) repeat protein